MESPFHLFSQGNEASDWTGFLESGSRIEGTLAAPGTFRLDGALTGRIVSHQLLVLGQTSEVEGEIEGERVVIYGRFRGTLRASGQVEIHSQATVSGDIYTPCLLLEPGGHFNGHCYLNPVGTTTDPLLVPIRANTSAEAGADQIEPESRVIRGRIE